MPSIIFISFPVFLLISSQNNKPSEADLTAAVAIKVNWGTSMAWAIFTNRSIAEIALNLPSE